jgi:hypothetical protein
VAEEEAVEFLHAEEEVEAVPLIDSFSRYLLLYIKQFKN